MATTALSGFFAIGIAAAEPGNTEAQLRDASETEGATSQPAELAQASPGLTETASRDFDIPPQPLSSALTLFGRQSGLQVAADSDLVAGLRTPGLKGAYPPEQALRQLLAGTGLGYTVSGPNTVMLQRGTTTTEGSAVALNPLVVYGARTTQTLNDVTASVGIVSDKEIDERELSNLRESFRLLANVRDTDFNDAGIVIRGINSEGLTPGGSPLASFYIDGVQQTVQGARRGARGLWDAEQVEVYRGPQSTLAGRAALAGAVYVKTKDPTNDYEVAGQTTFGTQKTREVAGMFNLPVVKDQVALRIAGEYQTSESDLEYPTYERFDRFDDYITNEFYNVRGKLLVNPNALPDTQGLLSYSYSEDSPDVRDIAGPALGFEFDEHRGDFNTPNFAEVRKTKVHNVGLQVTHDVTDRLLFTSQTGFSHSHTDRPSINAGTEGETDIVTGDFVQKLATHEFRLNYVGDAVDATFGIYGAYEKEDAGFDRPDFFGFATDVSRTDQKTWNAAAFGEATYEFYPSWKIVGGGRLDHTRQSGSSFFSRNGAVITDFDFTLNETVFLPKAGLIKEFGPSHTVGFVAQRGFRTGGAGVQRSTGTVFTFDPEFAWNYELSYKGSVYNDRLRLAANAFYLDIKDQQVETLADPLDPASSFISNAAKSRVFGFEVEAQAAITRGLTSFLALGYTNTKFEEFNLAGVEDLSGQSFPQAPEWTVAFGGFYQHPSGLFFGADAEYTDSFNARIGTPPQDRLKGYFIVNAQTGFRYENYKLSIFVENLFNEEYFLFADNDIASTLGRGRFVGGTVTATF
ncbi:MAG: TonB-dependent receptor [Pseudomonadota bacterium]